MGPECPCLTVHIIVELYPVGADEVNFTDICCPIYDTGHSGGLLGFEGRKSRGVVFRERFFYDSGNDQG